MRGSSDLGEDALALDSSLKQCSDRLKELIGDIDPKANVILHLEDMQEWAIGVDFKRRQDHESVGSEEYRAYFLIILSETLFEIQQMFPRFKVVLSATNTLLDTQIRVSSQVYIYRCSSHSVMMMQIYYVNS